MTNNTNDSVTQPDDIYTPEWLRSFKGCEHYSDESALQIIQTLKELCMLCFRMKAENKIYFIDNQCYVHLHPDHQPKKIAA